MLCKEDIQGYELPVDRHGGTTDENLLDIWKSLFNYPPPSISLVKQKRPMQCIFQSHDNEFLGVFHNNKRDNQLSIPFTNVRPEKLYPRLISQQYLSPLHTEWMYKKSMIIRFDFKGNLFFSALDIFKNIEVTETIY